MINKSTIVLKAYDRNKNTEHVGREIASIFHPKAREELHRDPKTVEHVQQWLRRRLQVLDVGKDDTVLLTLNPFNELNGLGIQSISVTTQKVIYGSPKEVRPENEWKPPTIGIVADGMLNKSFKMGEARFNVNRGRGELIYCCSEDLRIDGEKDGEIRPLQQGESILVEGPNAVRTYLQMESASPEQVREAVNHGVYICCFTNIGGSEPRGEDFSSALDE